MAPPGYYETPRLPLLALLGHTPPRRALEIGCGTAATLAALKARHRDCATTGVDSHAWAVAAAREEANADRLIEGDVLDPEWVRFEPGEFDLVILSHVLEHFAEPACVLDRVRGWLAPGGRLLVALPNIRHLSVLLPLLLRSDFEYQDAGIMDRTHLRFYTRKSAERFFAEQGWVVEAAAPDINGPKSRALHRLSLGLARDFAAYAWNFRLRAA